MMFPRKVFGMPAATPKEFRRRALDLLSHGERLLGSLDA